MGVARGPLTGYRVIELASAVSGPLCAAVLADQGADVIKIESEAGDNMRHVGDRRPDVDGLAALFLNLNRNKRSVKLDLADPAKVEVARRIIASADVLVQNFRPGVIDRMGLGYAEIVKFKPDIIFVSIDGLGQKGPAAKRRVYDVVVQGIAGFADANRDPATGEPRLVIATPTDKATSLYAAQAVTAALLHREKTGEGQEIHVSMLDAGLNFLWAESCGAATFEGEDVVRTPSIWGRRWSFPTSDGHILLAFLTDGEWRSVCTAIERLELVDDPRFRSPGKRWVNAPVIDDILKDAFLGRSTADWVEILVRNDAVVSPVNRPEDLANDPNIVALGSIEELSHPALGQYRQPVPPARFSRTPAGGVWRHAPGLGEHNDEVLRELGLD